MSDRIDNLLQRINNHPDVNKLNVINEVLSEIERIVQENPEDITLKIRALAAQRFLFAETAKIIAQILNQGKFT